MILFLLILSLFVFLIYTPRTCFAMARPGLSITNLQVIIWASSGTLFITLKFLV